MKDGFAEQRAAQVAAARARHETLARQLADYLAEHGVAETGEMMAHLGINKWMYRKALAVARAKYGVKRRRNGVYSAKGYTGPRGHKAEPLKDDVDKNIVRGYRLFCLERAA